MTSVVSKPPERSVAYSAKSRDHTTVFLAGSIEMGVAEDWQSALIAKFPNGVTFLNPRRDNWDSYWEQTIENPNFREQVEWELDNLEVADVIFLYLDPSTKSLVSLLELGLFADSRKLIVCCPTGFWRKGNVDIVCKRHGILVHEYLDTAIAELKTLLW